MSSMKLNLRKGNGDLIRSHNSLKGVSFGDLSNFIMDNIRNGSSLIVKTDNTYPAPHRGSYYLLYVQEYGKVYLLYVDVEGELRMIGNGYSNQAVTLIYKNISSDTSITVLKSSAMQSYRVIASDTKGGAQRVMPMCYKNKSGKEVNQVYLGLFDAIHYAAMLYHNDNSCTYSVVTKGGNSLFYIGPYGKN